MQLKNIVLGLCMFTTTIGLAVERDNKQLVEESSFDFAPNWEALEDSKLQFHGELMTRDQFKEDYPQWNIDELADEMASRDALAIGKVMFFVPDVQPEKFDLKKMMSDEFLNRYFVGTENEICHEPGDCHVKYTVNYGGSTFGTDVKTTTHVKAYSYRDEKGSGVSASEADQFINLFREHNERLDAPAVLLTTMARESDISAYSYGGRALNFLVPMNGGTLWVGMKLITLKVEGKVRWTPGVSGKVKKGMVQGMADDSQMMMQSLQTVF